MVVPDADISIRSTTESDLVFVLRVERSTDLVRHATIQEHRDLFVDPHSAHLLFNVRGQPAGYLILRDVATPDRSIRLQRIVVATPGQGVGRQILRMLKTLAFQELRAHRLWLDVMEDNVRARHLYQSEGFKTEGMFREACWRRDAFVSLIIMSILEEEWRHEPRRSPG